MIQPFADADVLFRFVPSEEEAREYGVRGEITLEREDDDFATYENRGSQLVGVFVPGLIIARLLRDREEMAAYIGSPGGPSYEELVTENDRLAADRKALTAKCDEMQMLIQGFSDSYGNLTKEAGHTDRKLAVYANAFCTACEVIQEIGEAMGQRCSGEAYLIPPFLTDAETFGHFVYPGDPAHCEACRQCR